MTCELDGGGSTTKHTTEAQGSHQYLVTMRRTVILYGLAMAALLGLLKLVEYKYMVRDIPLEFYIGVVAVMFTALGVWAGLRLTRPKIIEVSGPFQRDDLALKNTGISNREFEVLELIAAGLSNQDIADKLFVSTSTVKTHVSNVLAKLDASRRTEAIAKAKELRIIP
jgi:two-component system, NarL family, response regulator LiaR